jgi:hypothetical protein
VARAADYDKDEAEQKRRARTRAIEEMETRHAQIAVDAQRKIVPRLKTLEAEEVTARDLIRWFDIAVKIERVARGASVEPQHRGNARPELSAGKVDQAMFEGAFTLILVAATLTS